ncbi:MAG: GNAT family N-acetyltransferase [Acidimicrobiia bacterium]
MDITARPATEDDLEHLLRLYRRLEQEMVALKTMWLLADGLPEPVEAAFKEALDNSDAYVYLGEVDGVPLGFVVSRSEALLPQAHGERVGAVRLIYTEPETRGVGVGEAMITAALRDLREAGHRLLDAHVPPGHRNAKNFFEAAGFAARSIVMHRDDAQDTPAR